MNKRILYVNLGHEKSNIHDELIDKQSYDLDTCFNYDKFILVVNDNKYNYVIVEIKEEDERKFLVHYLLQQSKEQAILVVRDHNSKCLFEQECKFCQDNFNHKSVNFASSLDNLINFIEQPNKTKCDFSVNRKNI